jgi:hypothetical protein
MAKAFVSVEGISPAQRTYLHMSDACPYPAGVRRAGDAVLLAWHDQAMTQFYERGALLPGLTEGLL